MSAIIRKKMLEIRGTTYRNDRDYGEIRFINRTDEKEGVVIEGIQVSNLNKKNVRNEYVLIRLSKVETYALARWLIQENLNNI